MTKEKRGRTLRPLFFKWSGNRGFTLLELLIVVAIIGLIAAMAIPNLLTAVQKAKQKATMADMRTLGMMLTSYCINEQHYPIQGTDFTTIEELKNLLKNFVPLNAEPDVQDGWGTDFQYTNLDPDGETYRLESFGKDKADGPVDITPATSNDFENDLVMENGIFINYP